jgi:hypothetical protein
VRPDRYRTDCQGDIRLQRRPEKFNFITKLPVLTCVELMKRFNRDFNFAAQTAAVPDTAYYPVQEEDWIVPRLARGSERPTSGRPRE